MSVADSRRWTVGALTAGAVVAAADELGLVEVLVDGARPDEVARRCRMSLRSTTVLLEALGRLGLTDPPDEGGVVRMPREAATIVQHAGRLRLSASLRAGQLVDGWQQPDGAVARYEDVVTTLGWLSADLAATAAEQVSPQVRQVLDLGAGSAIWSAAVARRVPSCRVLAVDLPEVLPRTRRAVAGVGLADRFTVVAADLLVDELPTGADLGLLANICHLFSPAVTRALLGRLRGVLDPAGTVMIIDVAWGDSPDEQRARSVYACGLVTRTAGGALHRADDYRAWLRETGYGEASVSMLGGEPPLMVITAAVRGSATTPT